MTDITARLTTALADRYTIEREIGAGGMATVYLAEDVKHRRKVAVKVLRPEFAVTLGPERFVREIEIAANLSHPHILPLHDSGEADGFLYYVMPYVEGESLRERLDRDGKLSVEDAVRLTDDVAAALSYAHRQGIVHRDIKPENILLHEGVAMVADFGIARAVNAAGGTTLTQTGGVIGTPRYMSPEQGYGSKDVDARTDTYSLGCVLYEMLVGEPPAMFSDAAAGVRDRLTNTPPEHRRQLNAVPDRVEQALARSLAWQPEDRFDTISQFAEALGKRSGETMDGQVMRTAGLSAVAALAAFGVVYLITDWLGLPSWFRTWGAVLLGAGLPAVTAAAALKRVEGHWWTMRRAAKGGATALVGLGVITAGYMGMRELGIGPVGTLVAAGTVPERPRIVLADFTDRTGDSTLAVTVTEALRIDLDQSPAVRLMQPSAIGSVLERMGRPLTTVLGLPVAREIGEREGLDAVLAGEVRAAGGAYLLTARLEDPASRDVMLSLRETAADSTWLIDAIDRLSHAMRQRIGESYTSTRNAPPLSRVTTTSLAALRQYTEAVRVSRFGDDLATLPLLERAVELDSTFAAAWGSIGSVLLNLNVERGRGVEAEDIAHRLRDRIPVRERLQQERVHLYVTGDYEALLELQTAAGNLNGVGRAHLFMRRPDLAEEALLRALEELPRSGAVYTNLLVAQTAQGKWSAARSAIRRADSLGVVDPRLSFYAFTVSLDPEDPDQLAMVLNAVEGRPLNSGNILDNLLGVIFPAINLNALLGRVQQMDRWRAGLENALVRLGFHETVRIDAINRAAYQLRVVGDSAGAVQLVEGLLDRYPLADLPPLRRPYLPLADFYAEANQPARARTLLAEYEREIDPALRGAEIPALDHARGQLATAEGDYATAIAALRRADAVHTCPICVLPALARAFDLNGDRDSAIAVYERYLTVPWLGRLLPMGPFDWPVSFPRLDPYHRAGVLRRLGELYEERGDSAKAVAYYDEFVNLWKYADAELEPAVNDVRQRIVRLTGPS